MAGSFVLEDAQAFLRDRQLDGWLLEDFQHNNPIFWEVIGGRRHTTRRAFLLIPPAGVPRFLLHMIDAERLRDLGWPIDVYLSRSDQESRLHALLRGRQRLAMEYSPACALPVVSRVDAGTIEEVRALGIDVVSSGDVLQYAVARWSAGQLKTHELAATAVVKIAGEAFQFIGERLKSGVTEFEVCSFIKERFTSQGLWTEEGPDVAINAHSSDPHYQPTAEASARITAGDWVLIDLWAKARQSNSIYGDATWVGYVGRDLPILYQRVFDSVRRARDGAIRLLDETWLAGRELEGWQVDDAARQIIGADGFGPYFTHRLGHSLGESIHSSGVNLDGFETKDIRKIIPGVGFTIEPGVYLPEVGVRLEVDVYVDPATGPRVTTPVQDDIVRI
ncbi:MAG: M24 family metallopeptidase [Chloroflexota bacterium]